MAIAAVERRRAAGDEVLLIVGSDHGHETVSGVVDIEAELIAAGLKSASGPNDVLAVSSGTSSLIYLHPDAEARRDRLGDFLASQPWAGRVMAAADLGSIGQAPHNGLAFAVSLKADASENDFGIRSRSAAAKPRWGKPDRLGAPARLGSAVRAVTVLTIDGPGFLPPAPRGTGSRRSRAHHHAASRHCGAGWTAGRCSKRRSDARDHRRPVAAVLLAEDAQCRIPRAVLSRR
jgi:hypothetical protein